MKIPTHIAFIPDGNRRWAKEKGLPTLVGHTKGYDRFDTIVTHAQKLGIQYVTFWAFSTENWKRSEEEVNYLLDLFRKLFRGSLIKKVISLGGKINIIGDMSAFPEDIQKDAKRVMEETKDNSTITINIALNYGGRSEIRNAVQKIVSDKIDLADIDDELISRYLYTKDQPDPDVIVRTGGEFRLSGFLPWQGVYSELYFPEVYWPDFDEKELDKVLQEYIDRERRFGK